MDLSKQVERMVAFMDQEGTEKSQEIDAKAEEEYNILVGQMVLTERLRINNHFEKLEAGVEKSKIIGHSTAINNARLKLLKLREGVMEEVFQAALERIIDRVTNDSRHYKNILRSLIIQASVKIMVEKQHLRVREKDVNIVKGLVDDIAEEYKKITHLKVTFTIDNKYFLPNNIIGGVEVYDRRGKSKVVNTLFYRINLIRTMMMPVIRYYLFGQNPHRKFYT